VSDDDAAQATAIEVAREAQDKHSIEKDQAAFIKKEFDRRFGPTWHCVVGRNFGSYVTHESKNFIYFYLDQVLFVARARGAFGKLIETERYAEAALQAP
jgi:dynein light chain LC8-type